MTIEITPVEYRIDLQTPTTTIPDLSAFKQRLPNDIDYVKLRLNSFSLIIENSAGTTDAFEVSLSTNVYSPYMLGDTPRNNLYTAGIKIIGGDTEALNDFGETTKYLIVHKNDLNGSLRLNWTITPMATGVAVLHACYASISLIPMKSL